MSYGSRNEHLIRRQDSALDPGRENASLPSQGSPRACAARNTGIAKSKGEFIAFLDDDDEWKPDSLEKRIALLEKLSEKEQEELGVVYCGCETHILHENRDTYNMPKIEGNIKIISLITISQPFLPHVCFRKRHSSPLADLMKV